MLWCSIHAAIFGVKKKNIDHWLAQLNKTAVWESFQTLKLHTYLLSLPSVAFVHLPASTQSDSELITESERCRAHIFIMIYSPTCANKKVKLFNNTIFHNHYFPLKFSSLTWFQFNFDSFQYKQQLCCNVLDRTLRREPMSDKGPTWS